MVATNIAQTEGLSDASPKTPNLTLVRFVVLFNLEYNFNTTKIII